MEYIFEFLRTSFTAGHNPAEGVIVFDVPLVILSFVFAFTGTFIGLHSVSNVGSGETGPEKRSRLIAGAAAMGGGVWAMHFIGMLAINTDRYAAFDSRFVLLSMVPAFIMGFVAVKLLAREKLSVAELSRGSVFVVLGVVAMHITSVTTFHMQAVHDPFLLILSLVACIIFIFLALYVRTLIMESNLKLRLRWANVIGAAMIGATVTYMHYKAERATVFTPVNAHNRLSMISR